MKARTFATALALLLVTTGPARAEAPWWQRGRELVEGLGGSEAAAGALSQSEVAAGLKQALTVGTERVVAQLGQPGGFSADPAVRIPLPRSLDSVRSALGRIGLSGELDALEQRLNEAAELATPKARDLFVAAISQMTLDDARQILSGPDDAATRYFQEKMSPPLAAEMTPVVQDSLSEVGAVKQYDQVMGQYRALPFVPDAKADLSAYVVDKGMDGIFHYLARQEAAIRSDPAARTTELLQKVFGAQ